jgi:hypothetical protein
MRALRMLTAVVVSAVLAAGQSARAAEPCRVTRSELDGREQVVMANDYVSLTFTPSQGGRCTRFLYEPTGALWAGDAAGTHLLGDRIWEQQGGSRPERNESVAPTANLCGSGAALQPIRERHPVWVGKSRPEVIW